MFCRMASGEVPVEAVRDTDHTFAFQDINPQAPTHVLVIPKAHYATMGELLAADPDLLLEVMRAATAVAAQVGADTSGYRLVFNTGAHGGQTVDHVHAHVLGGRRFSWPPG